MKKAILFVFAIILNIAAHAQNCSVNSGSAFALCESLDTFQLAGNSTGLFNISASWSQLSGPNSSTIVDPTNPNTQVADFIRGVYVYRISAQCQDGTNVFQNVTVTIDTIPKAKVNDTTFCFNGNIVPQQPSPAIPVGQTVSWRYIQNNALLGNSLIQSILQPTMPNTSVCNRASQIELTVTNGSCAVRDTAIVASEYNSVGNLIPHPDVSVCGTTYTSNPGLIPRYGCNAISAMTQLSGPNFATIVRSGPNSAEHYYSFSNLIPGTYTFAFDLTLPAVCGGTNFKDTFKVTVSNIVTLPVPEYPSIFTCGNAEDTVYTFKYSYPIPFGMTGYWILDQPNPYSTLVHYAQLKMDTANGILKVRTTNPGIIRFVDISSTFRFVYVVAGPTSCTVSSFYDLFTQRPPVPISFKKVINLPCGATSGNIVLSESGGFVNTFGQGVFISTVQTPDGASNPTISSSTVSGLVNGKYIFKLTYYYTAGGYVCPTLNDFVEVNVSGAATVSNAGTNQILPCGVDSTVLAGNSPVAGNGRWELVSGPSSLVLSTPTDKNLLVKNLQQGAYTLRWTIRNSINCTSTDETTIFVTKVEGPSLQDTLYKCFGMPVQIKGTTITNPTATALWSQYLGPPVTISNTSVQNPIITGTIANETYGFERVVYGVCDTFVDTVVVITSANQGPSNGQITTSDRCITTETLVNVTAVAPAVGNGVWRFISGPTTPTIANPTFFVTSISGITASGVYLFVWEVSTGAACDTLRDTISITRSGITGNYTASSPSEINLCESDTAIFNATAFSTNPAIGWVGTWTQTQGDPTTIETIGTTGAKVYTLKPGKYQYKWTVGLGTCPTASSLTNVNVFEKPAQAEILNNDTLICGVNGAFSQTIAFNANTPNVGSSYWQVLNQSGFFAGDPLISTPDSVSTNIALFRGYYNVVYNIVNGACISSDTTTVEIVPLADAGVNRTFCGENPIILNRGNYASYGNTTVNWSQRRGPNSATITSPNTPATSILGTIPGRYVFDFTINHPVCGILIDSVVIAITSFPTNVFAGNDTSVCFAGTSTSIPLRANTPSGFTSVTWARITSPGGTITFSPSGNSLNTNAIVNTAGLHQFRLTVNNGTCSAIDFVDVVVEQVPTPAINLSSANICNDTVTVQTATNIPNYLYDWTFQDAYRYADTSGFDLAGPLVNHWEPPTGLGNKKITLTLTNPISGCFSKDSVFSNLSCILLPVNFGSLEVECEGAGAKILWSTLYEFNNSKFEVEKTTDGKYWESIGSVQAIGLSYLENFYSFYDTKSPKNTPVLYRIKQIDNNGDISYSGEQQAMCTQNMAAVGNVVITPNPFHGALNIRSTGGIELGSVVIYNSVGLRVYANKTSQESLQIETHDFAPGVYVIKVNGENIKLIKN